jgi:hypothetical protein
MPGSFRPMYVDVKGEQSLKQLGLAIIAAERTGRKARALEVDPSYVDVGVRRWQSYTGKTAVLAASGETFETIEEQRAAKPAAA